MGICLTLHVRHGDLRVYFKVARTVAFHSDSHKNYFDLRVDPWSSKGVSYLLLFLDFFFILCLFLEQTGQILDLDPF